MTGERTALKEWAVLVDAMAHGDIVAMVRKGGIREQRAGFSVRHERFLLYPTYFHEKQRDLAPRFIAALDVAQASRPPEGMIELAFVADVAGMWRVLELDRLQAIGPEHGLAWHAVESRFHYRDRPGVQVIAARVSRLREPVRIPETRRYQGCVSWVELDSEVDVDGAIPVLPEEELHSRVARLDAALGPERRDGQ